MSKVKVRVIVAGLSNTGKSTIVQMISELLESAGIACVGRINEDLHLFPTPSVDKVFQRRRIKAIVGKTFVEIEERNMYHSLMPGEPPKIAGVYESGKLVKLMTKPVKLSPKRKTKVQPRRKK